MNARHDFAMRRHVLQRFPALAAVAVLASAPLVLATTPAAAHSGGKAIVLVEALTIAPEGSAWQATAVLADYDGGGALEAVDARAKGAGLLKPTSMTETMTPGTYRVALPAAEPGPIRLTLDIRTLPGGTPVTRFTETFEGTLVADQTLSLVENKSAPLDAGDGGGGNTGVLAAGAGGVLALTAVALFTVRRRSGVPAPAK